MAGLLLAAGSLTVFGQPATRWLVRGEAVVTCPCKVPCPCRSNAPPSQPHCENLSYVRIVEGSYGATRLNGLEYVWAANECQGRSRQPKATTLYFGRNATAGQIGAVESIMSGEHCAGGAQSEMKAKRVNLSAGTTRSLYSVRVPALLRLDVDLAPGPVPMEPLPALDSWSNTVTYARNVTARIDDRREGLKWDYSGMQANYRTFEVGSELLEKGLMLALYRDDSGRFNEMHRNLIRELHLEVPLTRDEFEKMLRQVRTAAPPPGEGVGKDPSGALGGTVFGPDGKPRSGVRIRLTSAPARPVPAAVSNGVGAFFLARVTPGVYQGCGFSWDGKTAEKGCAPVTIKAGSVLRQDLRLAAVPVN